MTGTLATLRRKRTGVFLLNLVYFLALLGLGTLLFLRGQTAAVYILVAACVVLYLLVVRPVTKRYVAQVRSEILAHTVGALLEGYTYEPKSGVTARQVQDTGLVPTSSPKSFFSREHITGHQGPIQVEVADVTFPIREGNMNAMFSGCYLRLNWPGASLPALTIRQRVGDDQDLPFKQRALLEEISGFIPGNFYLKTEGETAEVLLRGRFLGFRINPLLPVSEQILRTSPLPELELLLRLVRLMDRKAAARSSD